MRVLIRLTAPSVSLTPINPHLAVQYQMCVVPQLPHVLLLSTTLRQGTPTSLSKCVFGGGEVWAWTFAALYPKVFYADKPGFRGGCANVRFLAGSPLLNGFERNATASHCDKWSWDVQYRTGHKVASQKESF